MNTDRYLLGFDDIDKQHLIYFKIIKTLRDAIASRDSEADINDFIQKIIVYIKDHFTFEEKLMLDSKFTEFTLHQREHRQFIMQIAAYNVRNSNGNPPGGYEILSTLQQFLVEHMNKTDREFVEYYTTNQKTVET